MNGIAHLMHRLGTMSIFGMVSLPGVRSLISNKLRPTELAFALETGHNLIKQPRRVLALTSHPDDLEFFAGGTLRRLVLAGSEIIAGVLTDGEKGGNRPALGLVRRSEMMRCAEIIGYSQVEFCGLTDYGMAEDPRLEREISRLWRKYRPDIVFAFDPKELVARMANRDHKALGRAVADLARHHVDSDVQVYFYGTRQPNVLVDISPVIEDKIKAVLSHQSQHIYLPRGWYDNAARYYGQICAAGAYPYAESFYRLI